MNKLLTQALLAAYLLLVVLCTGYLAYHWLEHTPWHKERLLRQLLIGDSDQRVRAATALAQVGGEKELLAALKSENEETREVAQRALEHLWFLSSGQDAYRKMQAAYQAAEEKDLVTALDLLNRLIESYPKYAEAWNRRASVYWELGQYEKSIADCEKALALNANHYGAWQGIGVCRLQLGDVAEACRCLRAALRIAPHDQATRQSLERCEELLKPRPRPRKKSARHEVI